MFYDRRLHAANDPETDQQQAIRRLADGSIDYAHYATLARRHRSETFIGILKRLLSRQ